MIEGESFRGSAGLVAMPCGGKHPGKVSGAWVLRGTRMPVSIIFENIEAGANVDEIMEWFEGLDREQVEAVIEFAARSLEETPFWDTLRSRKPGSLWAMPSQFETSCAI